MQERTGRRTLLVVNRRSREGNSDLSAALEYLQRRGLELIEVYPERPQQVAALIERHRERVDRVVVGGGDGTLNAAAPGIVACGLPVGVLPLGTANDLARTLGIPTQLPEAAEIIAQGHLRRIDLGVVNGRYFFNAAHIGLGVGVTLHLSHALKRRWGALGYLHGLYHAFRENRAFRAEVTCDGAAQRVRSIEIAIGNGRHYGGGMTIAEDAAIDDHLLHLYSIRPQSVWRLLRLAPALRSGRYGDRSQLLLLRGRHIEVRTRTRMPIDTDGEVTTHTPARFELHPAALAVYAPPASSDPLQEPLHAAG